MGLFSSIISAVFPNQNIFSLKKQPLGSEFTRIGEFHEGYARVKNIEGDWYNFVNKNGELLSQEWFNDIGDFSDGGAPIQRNNGKWNFIDKDYKILSKDWFNDVGMFSEGFAPVKVSGKGWNFIDISGTILSKSIWFDSVSDFSDGGAEIFILGRGQNIILKSGKLLDKWYGHVKGVKQLYYSTEYQGGRLNYIEDKSELSSRDYIYRNSANAGDAWRKFSDNNLRNAITIDNENIVFNVKKKIYSIEKKIDNNKIKNEYSSIEKDTVIVSSKSPRKNDQSYLNTPLWKELKQVIFDTKGRICSECDDTIYLDVHHILPRHMGGKDELSNLVVLCRSCHEDIHGYEIGTGENKGKPISKKLQSIHKALENEGNITIIYKDEKEKITERTITPKSLYYEHQKQYLIAYCHLRKTSRTFRIARIQNITE